MGAIRAGVMGLYRARPGLLSGFPLGDALVFADTATLLLLDASHVRRSFKLITKAAGRGTNWTTRERHTFVGILSDDDTPVRDMRTWSATRTRGRPGRSTGTTSRP
ncbi:MAG: hypothetical protein ACR2MP_24315 [Streptosporangiaceae bacterium]